MRNSIPAAAAGYLQKRASTSALAGWQTRFFVGYMYVHVNLPQIYHIVAGGSPNAR